MTTENKTSQAYFKYLLALLLFGFNGIVAHYILLSSYEIVFLRTLIGSIFLIVVFFCSKRERKSIKNKKHFAYMVVSGMAMGASWMFLYEAYSEVGVSVATLAYYCGPVIVILLSPLLFRERLTIRKILGFVVVLLGMYFVNGSALRQNGFSWGLLCGILAAMLYAVMVIFNKKALSIAGIENAMFQLIFGFLVVTVFMQIKQGLVIPSLFENIIPVLILGIVNTGIGCYFYFSAIQKLPATSVAICGYLEPVSALIFAGLFLQERLAVIQIVGAILIIFGATVGEISTFKSRNG